MYGYESPHPSLSPCGLLAREEKVFPPLLVGGED
ncbi:hypothetical protein MNBD_NITROSPINAE05-77 [hydrothermal vent metagenome]|uniref:Uncharacterized protein n=1 Tax=hydrothermal vent metagenome TaxID=652676 RepID=A0A3B1CXU2_9ZZZZ